MDTSDQVSTRPSIGHIQSLVKKAKKARKNRVYYENTFKHKDLYKSGVIQSEQKAALDRVNLNKTEFEAVNLFGFNTDGSYFKLSVSILPLFTDIWEEAGQESRWRLGKVKFTYVNNEDSNNINNNNNSGRCEYSYECEQLIDYEEKRSHSSQHESRNIYSIGSISIENVLPYSLSRILFNGLLTRKVGGQSQLVSAKVTISTHPLNDKFDYQYNFDTGYLSGIINNSLNDAETVMSAEKLLELALEDRIDQALMFQGRIELLGDSNKEVQSFIMWGAKLKQVINLKSALSEFMQHEDPFSARENLFMWSECGHQVHLTRPTGQPSLVCGLINSPYEYASYLYEAKLLTNDGRKHFTQLSSFAKLNAGCEISLKGYKIKEYLVKILDRVGDEGKPFRVLINDFKGWAFYSASNFIKELREAQRYTQVVDITNEKSAFLLSSEKLLGGKGNSLVDLNRLIVQRSEFDFKNFNSENGKQRDKTKRNVSVPRGVVVSCLACQMWLGSSNQIRNSLRDLDNKRRIVAARSIYLNPMSDKHLTLAKSQKTLRDQCEKTGKVLRSSLLPEDLKKVLYEALSGLFTKEELSDDDKLAGERRKIFAVRSSAVGEDSLETSAAGQMKTYLDIRGFKSICQAVVDCWASQFSMEAVTYKSENGLQFILPMAVVIQELIPCKAAGVAATCDAMTGDKRRLEILANPGLGEGVVSGGQADSIRVSLKHLTWNNQLEHPIGELTLKDVPKSVTKIVANEVSGCCLSDKQIVSLANLLLWLRKVNTIRDREVEWGITLDSEFSPHNYEYSSSPSPASSSSSSSPPSSSSSSSSSDSDANGEGFHVYLLQSRPLTNLNRLSSREIDHELDYGFPSPLDIVSRANLGEVMPGALCVLNSTYFLPVVSNRKRKPFEPNHTRKSLSPDSFGFHGQVISMILTSSDVLSRFPVNKKDDKKQDEIMAIRMMIGTLSEATPKDEEERERLNRERINPLSAVHPSGLAGIIALDLGLLRILMFTTRKKIENCTMMKKLTSIDEFIRRLKRESSSERDPIDADLGSLRVLLNVKEEIKILFKRLTNRTDYLSDTWETHIRATMISMAYNVMCLKLLSIQKAYPGKMSSSELLNDFSILMRNSGEKTESGDILNLLGKLISTMAAEGRLEDVKKLNEKQLYDYLETGEDICARMYRNFMKNNGHRTYKEFDLASATWADDPSYIIKSLIARLKSYDPANTDSEKKQKVALEQDQETKSNEIVNNKVDSFKSLLTGYLLPRARHAVVRREQSKSMLIKVIDKYRSAFRHLGGLLCLVGWLPRADLIFYLSIEELDRIVRLGDGGCQEAELSRIIYKARRRQQRQRILNRVTFARPVIGFQEMVDTVREVSEADELVGCYNRNNEVAAAAAAAGMDQSLIGSGRKGAAGKGNQAGDAVEARLKLVRGMTSCAGLVTGRACVVYSLEDMNEIEPNDILITYSIDISWSVYFFTLAGIVTEIGGIVSHGAVVAREYGIPTLCNAFGACSIFKTGQIVTLNANQGICYLADSEA